MEEREVRRVGLTFESLQIVAVLDGLRDIEMVLGERRPFIIWENRNVFCGAHVGEDHSGGFFARVGRMANLVLQRAAGGFRRSF